MKLFVIDSLLELRRRAAAWDDLWWRSPTAMPTHRAELVAQWVEQFAINKRFVALCAEDEGQLVAALPLTSQHRAGLIGSPPSNCWSCSGEMLIDLQCSVHRAVELIAAGLRRTPWALLMIEDNLALPSWKLLGDALPKQRVAAHQQHKFRAGVIDIIHDWESYSAAWSANHRRAMKKLRAKAEQSGSLELQSHTELRGAELTRQLRLACEIEDRSWKGAAGTSIHRSPGMFEFFHRQAEQLFAWNQLELYFLHHNGRAIAFDYCYAAKGQMGSHKIGYDEECRDLGPGQLLRLLQLQRWQGEPERLVLDTLGMLDEAKAKWCTRTYEVGRLTCSTGTLCGSAGMFAYQHVRPMLAKLRGREPELLPDMEAGAARCLAHRDADVSGELASV